MLHTTLTQEVPATDQLIIDRIVNGDLPLFEVLIRRYNPILYRVARGYGFSHQDAEDLLQETHVSAYLALQKFQGRASYKTWITKIMIHKCIYKLKYGYYKNEVMGDDLTEVLQKPEQEDNFTENAVINKELIVVIENSLQEIPTIYRSVFMLREVEGLSVAETADLLNITEINVKVRLNRAKALLQKKIGSVYSTSDLYSFNLIYCDRIVSKVFEGIRMISGGSDNSQITLR
jgi:RNA polymerase sigma factor (sigma-70 family)